MTAPRRPLGPGPRAPIPQAATARHARTAAERAAEQATQPEPAPLPGPQTTSARRQLGTGPQPD